MLLSLAMGTASTMGWARADQAAPAQGAAAKPSPRNVVPAEFDALRKGTNTIVLDVRTASEYADGHLPEALLLDFRAPDFEAQVAKLDRSRIYLVHCAGGGRSARACVKMISLGFTNVVNLEGGLGAWTEEGRPLEK